MTTNPLVADDRTAVLDRLAAVSAMAQSLRDELAKDRPDLAFIKGLNAQLGRALKVAEIHAALHQASTLERIAKALERLAGTAAA